MQTALAWITAHPVLCSIVQPHTPPLSGAGG